MKPAAEAKSQASTRISAAKIEWTVPKKWHLKKARTELSTVLNFGSLARIIVVSVILALGIRYWAETAWGPLDFNWIRAIVTSVLAGIGYLAVGIAEACMPPTIRVSAKGIDVLKGRRSIRLAFNDLAAISIQGRAPAILSFRKGTRDYHYAIADSLDCELLRRELERLSGQSVQVLPTADQQCGPANEIRPIRSETSLSSEGDDVRGRSNRRYAT